MLIPREYFIENDTLWLARDLLGKILYCNSGLYGISAGIITETEAYMGATDQASHAYGNRRTKRTEIMFQNGGVSYVYLCYGIHHLFNIVTNQKDVPHAILVRAIKPVAGIENISKRLNKTLPLRLDGPGKLTKALGINLLFNGIPLDGKTIWLEDRKIHIPALMINTGPRIGVDYAGDDAKLPLRFWVGNNSFLPDKIDF
jgi:DNA-3-methyladenine glycosylase